MGRSLDTNVWHSGELLKEDDTKKFISEMPETFAFDFVLTKGSEKINKTFIYDSSEKDFKNPYTNRLLASEFKGYEVEEFKFYKDGILSKIHELDDEDIPTVKSEAISDIEKKIGHGFWGNATTGYISNEDN